MHQSARDLSQISDLQAQLEEATKEKQEIQEKVQDIPQLPAGNFLNTSVWLDTQLFTQLLWLLLPKTSHFRGCFLLQIAMQFALK